MTYTNNTLFILFGATGDLAVKKIFPALSSLMDEGAYGPGSKILAISRRDWKHADFHNFLIEKKTAVSSEFLKSVLYSKIDIEGGHGYEKLKKTITELKKKYGLTRVFIYLSLAPQNHPLAIQSLKDSRILTKGKTRILIEKPFGTDEKTAKSLDKLLSYLNEEQICRVDHYLGKDTMLAVMNLHESTFDFDNLIAAESVSSIHIRHFETKGIEGRGASYDRVGAFRDVGQNHMLEMLAVVCARLPDSAHKHQAWQKARAEVFMHLAPPLKTCDLSRRGQYEGYHQEHGVTPRSATETAFEVETHLSSGKLIGTPLFLESGKKMHVSEAFIRVDFKEISGLPKSMRFSIQPEQEIVIENRDGTTDTFVIPKHRDAYANIIYAALTGSTREFVGRDEIEALWRYADHVVACWDKAPLEIYGDKRSFLIK